MTCPDDHDTVNTAVKTTTTRGVSGLESPRESIQWGYYCRDCDTLWKPEEVVR